MRTIISNTLMPVLMLTAVSAFGQAFPNKPIRILASEIGGGNDFVSRQLTPGLTASLGQQVIVENRGLIAPEIVSKATPDGYTLLINGGQLWLLPFLRDKVAYDPVRDFTPITMAVTSAGIVVVHTSVPANSIKDLIALAKAKPGELNYAAGALGAIPHLAAELFKNMTGTNIVHVPYKGNGPALNAVIGGQVQIMFTSAGTIAQHVTSGRLRALAVTTAKPSVLFPELPTVAATVPGYEAATLTAIFAPRGTPAAIVQRLNREMVKELNKPEIKERFAKQSIEVIASTPEDTAAKIKSEMTRLGKVIKEAGIRE